jgi:hypothetical protein
MKPVPRRLLIEGVPEIFAYFKLLPSSAVEFDWLRNEEKVNTCAPCKSGELFVWKNRLRVIPGVATYKFEM